MEDRQVGGMLKGQNVFIGQVFTNVLSSCLNNKNVGVTNMAVSYLDYQQGFEPL